MPQAQVFQREGEFWTVAYEGRVSIADARGLQHLARLLANPGREAHALELAADGAAPGVRLEPHGAYRGRYEAPLLRLLARLGDRDRFHARWDALADRDRSSLGGRFTTLAVAEGLAVLGDRDAAAALAGEVDEALAGGLVLTFVDLRLVCTVAGLAAAAGDGPAADEHFRAAVAQADALPHRIEAANARRLWAHALLDRGERASSTDDTCFHTRALPACR
ncbi:hypothetical protein [Pseudonocardia nigra]|uniref:hypothetical protein n=1 Tax=Pseudonocardia nigra TaxID=1921578 RepID=UPI001C5E2B4A|nr:hypothetical protein [Pseudonocardia nigra]